MSMMDIQHQRPLHAHTVTENTWLSRGEDDPRFTRVQTLFLYLNLEIPEIRPVSFTGTNVASLVREYKYFLTREEVYAIVFYATNHTREEITKHGDNGRFTRGYLLDNYRAALSHEEYTKNENERIYTHEERDQLL